MLKEEALRYIENLKWLKGFDNTKIGVKSVAEILDEIAEMINDGWFSVKDKLPEENGEYLIVTDDRVTAAYYEHGRRKSEWTDYFEGYINFEPTHWMPLPAPPEKSKGE